MNCSRPRRSRGSEKIPVFMSGIQLERPIIHYAHQLGSNAVKHSGNPGQPLNALSRTLNQRNDLFSYTKFNKKELRSKLIENIKHSDNVFQETNKFDDLLIYFERKVIMISFLLYYGITDTATTYTLSWEIAQPRQQ